MCKWVEQFSKVEAQMSNKHMKQGSPSLAIKATQIKTSLRLTAAQSNAGPGAFIDCWHKGSSKT
jgi:hypothetical protein